MAEIDNCPVCNTTCNLEYGLEDFGDEYSREILYASCKTCKTRWRRRDDHVDLGKMIYEKWACRIPETNIPFPFVGGGIRLHQKWCRWKYVKERRIPASDEMEHIRDESKFEETISIDAGDYGSYDFELTKGDQVTGDISSDVPVDVWFLDEKNFDKFERKKRFEEEDGTEQIYETKLNFLTSKKGLWFVAIANSSKTKAKVKVRLYSQKSS